MRETLTQQSDKKKTKMLGSLTKQSGNKEN